jgi:predicted PurR-regulated permease PerM
MAIVLIGFGVLFFGSIWMFGIQIFNQADQLFWAVSDAYRQLQEKLAQYHIVASSSPGGLDLESPAKAAASGVVWASASIVLIVFLGVYLPTAPQLYSTLFLNFFDPPFRKRVARLLEALASALRWWLAGQLIAMAAVGVITASGLLLIGAPMAISLSVLAAMLTFIPYIGAIVSAIPAILLALTKSTEMAMYVVLIYLVAHIVEGYILVPLIQHRMVYMPPAMILAAQFLMELFAGVIGVTFATPLMVVGMVLIKRLYFKQDWDESADEAQAA